MSPLSGLAQAYAVSSKLDILVNLTRLTWEELPNRSEPTGFDCRTWVTVY